METTSALSPRSPSPSGPEPTEAGVMTLVEHLEELRRRLFISLGTLALTSLIGFIVAPYLIDLIIGPYRAQLQILTPSGGFFVQVKLAIIIGLALALPIVVFQLWRFVAPGLTTRERAAVRPWLPLAAVFFALGVAVAYVVLPFAWAFLTAFNFGLPVDVSFEAFFGFVLLLFLAFGIVMEFPLVLVLLSKLGILPLALLKRQRRYALLVIVIFAVVVTPGGDPVSPTVMSIVMYALYELTILILSRGAAPATGGVAGDEALGAGGRGAGGPGPSGG
ncbi:MAG TPA: twin-arginine translocase subunit TatC [Candidatus Limnocylindrales bacterium]|nr:twin-arginine translocase subunit TatC [Candidatus Limnocylindrales bacterium]